MKLLVSALKPWLADSTGDAEAGRRLSRWCHLVISAEVRWVLSSPCLLWIRHVQHYDHFFAYGQLLIERSRIGWPRLGEFFFREAEFARGGVEGVQSGQQGGSAAGLHCLQYSCEVGLPVLPKRAQQPSAVLRDLKRDFSAVFTACLAHQQACCLQAIAQPACRGGNGAELIREPHEIDRLIALDDKQCSQLGQGNLRLDAFEAPAPDHHKGPGSIFDLCGQFWWKLIMAYQRRTPCPEASYPAC